ncbi:SDR family oxidoreductase [Actinoallomurus vinaceus]|uniref:SDR family oxidoreductase n=1 Tax=Actinoallomurus vinaceus TaxID=1080074 RepID=A0ABP8URI7_9ACTN
MASIAVIGATGRTGRIIVDQALTLGHQVTAIARRPVARPRLTVVTADVQTPGSLHGTLDDHDVVISAVGAAGRGPTTVYSAGTSEIISAMKPGRRLIVISSAGLGTPADAGATTRLLARGLHRLMRHTYADMTRMEELLADTELAWTAVRPTRLTDRPAGGRPRTSIGATGRVGAQTSRADLAAVILDLIDDPRTHRTAVAVFS